MGGITGMIVDTFQRQKQHEYEQILKLCHLHGVPLSKNLLERGKMIWSTTPSYKLSWLSLYKPRRQTPHKL